MDFFFLASEAPIPLDASNSDRRVQWLIEHERSFNDTDGFLVTGDSNPMERRQVRKSEADRKLVVERIAFELLLH